MPTRTARRASRRGAPVRATITGGAIRRHPYPDSYTFEHLPDFDPTPAHLLHPDIFSPHISPIPSDPATPHLHTPIPPLTTLTSLPHPRARTPIPNSDLLPRSHHHSPPPFHLDRANTASTRYSDDGLSSRDSRNQPIYQYVDQPDSPPGRKHAFNMADAARAAKDKLTRRFSFHARTPNKSPEKHTPVSQSARARPESAPQAPLVSANQPIANALPRDIPGSVSALPTDHSIHVQVRHWVLEGNGTGLRKSGKLAEWKKKAGPYKTVKVEANPAGLAPTSLYACHKMINSPLAEPFRETQFITSRPEYVDTDTIVYQDTPFEIAVVGMSVSRHDFKLGYPDHNEILMYSLHRGPAENDETDALPCIHYDPSKDDSGRGSIPDQFIPIPASKSLFMASNGFEKGIEPRTSVNCQFKILELDQVDHYTQLSLSGIEQLTNQFSQFSRTPNLGLLTPAMNLASTMSRKAIDSHATSDKVLMIDMNFYLAERKRPEINPTDGSEIPFEHRSGEYLRFGYYFFLSKKVDAKLYASFRTFPNVSLMMKRTDTDNLGPGEHEFFPLTGVSYLVIRVMPKMSSMRATRRPIRLSHVQRLENLMKTSLVSKEDPKDVVSHLADLAKDLGICTDDVDGDVSEVSRPADSSTSQNEH